MQKKKSTSYNNFAILYIFKKRLFDNSVLDLKVK